MVSLRFNFSFGCLCMMLFLLLSSCNISDDQSSINDTRWEYKVSDSCISSLNFDKNGNYENFNCEMNYTYSGKYQKSNDTIYLTEFDINSNLPDSTENEQIIRRSTLVKNENSLEYISWEAFEDNKWSGAVIRLENVVYHKAD